MSAELIERLRKAHIKGQFITSGNTTDAGEASDLIEELEQQLAEREQERRGVIAESKMHPLWLEKSKEELLDALRFQGATTAALLEETADYQKQIVMLRETVEKASNYIDVLGGDSKGYRQALTATATADLRNCIICDAKPVARFNWNEGKFEWLTKYEYYKHHLTQLYQARKQK